MKKYLWIILGSMAFAYGCSSSGATKVGETTGSILRAPVDFVSGFGRGVTGRGHMPLRDFRQNWEVEESDPVFWETDDKFFAGL